MGIFQQFPYSNFHEFNLDEIIKIMRQMQDEWAATKAEWASYKDFIDNYFANLDVSEEVLEALRTMAASGELNTIMDPTIAAETAAWLALHITQPTTPAIDTSLTVAGAAADAKAAGDRITDNNSNMYNLRGDKNVIADVCEIFGYELPYFKRKAWDYGNAVLVDSNAVVCSEPIPYSNYDYLIVSSTDADIKMRITFLSGTSILANTGWIAPTRLRNGSGADNFTIEFKYSDNSNIDHIGNIVNKTKLMYEKKITYFVEEKDFNPMVNPLLKAIEDEGCIIPEWDHNGYDFANHVWIYSTTIMSTVIDYEWGVPYTIVNNDPSTYKFRVTFFDSNTDLSSTGWKTDTLTLRNVLAGVEAVGIEIAYTDNSTIIDSEIMKNFRIQIAPAERIVEDITTMGIFDKWATIGDSFSVGRWYTFPGGVPTPVKTSRLAWGSIIAREVGNTFLSLGVGGINTRTWLSDPNGLAKALASPQQDLYFLCLGINDTSLGSVYIGDISDIHDNDYTLNPDSFYGNYGKIIQQMKNYAPNALFVISKLVAWNNANVKDAYNDAIEKIADHYGIPLIDPMTDDFFNSGFWMNYRGHNEGHPTGMTYGGMAKAYQRLMNKAFNEYPDYFKYYNGVAD